MTMAAEIKNRQGSHSGKGAGCLKRPFPAVGRHLQQRGAGVACSHARRPLQMWCLSGLGPATACRMCLLAQTAVPLLQLAALHA